MKYFKFEDVKKNYDQILYFGDGVNDLCGISLIDKGEAYIRKSYSLHGHLNQAKHLNKHIRVESKFWDDGFELTKYVK